ncbi:MAG: 3-phosphoshikimate 1-carboxyvinyltransferase [Actinomycetota bacterium]|nr:3-phosphoshikimate 1-carboxyvinyltransferase [Actinomycetota bacterium]
MTTTTSTAIRPAEGPLRGRVRVPGDKSVAHRAAIVGAIARGATEIRAYPESADAEATLSVLSAVGIPVRRTGVGVRIEGRGWDGFRAPRAPVSCMRSGTTMRLMAGVLAAAGSRATLTGDPQLLARPMERVADPLRVMGARITTEDGRPPIEIEPAALRGVRYELPVASAQVKSAILLAGLRAAGETTVVERLPTRDHTERLLSWLDARISIGAEVPRSISIRPSELAAFELEVPGDPSSAAPILAAAALIPGSEVVLDGVGLNPSRTAFAALLSTMGARIDLEENHTAGPEPVGRIVARHGALRAASIGADEVPALIDELPLVGVVAAFAEGVTEVRGAGELRVKESDRIRGLVENLRLLGVDAEEVRDGFVVRGPSRPRGGGADARGDHRLAMALAVLGLAAEGPVSVAGMDSVDDSFPGFLDTLDGLR